MSALKLEFVLSAVDRASARVRAVQDEIDGITLPARKARAALNSLAETGGIHRLIASIRNAGQAAANLGRSVALGLGLIGGAAAAAWFGMKRVADKADQINDQAQELGMTAKRLQELGYVFQLNGGNKEEAAQSLLFMQNQMSAALSGSKEAKVHFDRLGISMQQLRTMNPGDVVERMGVVFSTVADTAANAARKVETTRALLGRSGTRWIPTLNDGADAMHKLYAEANRVGAVLSDDTIAAMAEFNDSVDRAGMTIFGVIATALRPASVLFTDLVNRIATLVSVNRELIAQRVGQFIQQISDNLPEIIQGFRDFAGGVKALIGYANTFSEAVGGWGNVLKIAAALMAGNVLLNVLQLGLALGAVAKSIGLVSVLVPAMIGPFAASVGVLRAFGAALWAATGPVGIIISLVSIAWAVVSAWEPAYKLFSRIADVLVKIGGFAWDKIKGAFGFGDASPKPAAPVTERPVVTSPITGTSPLRPSADIGGRLKIEIDSAGRPKVKDLVSSNPNFSLDVGYTGQALSGL